MDGDKQNNQNYPQNQQNQQYQQSSPQYQQSPPQYQQQPGGYPQQAYINQVPPNQAVMLQAVPLTPNPQSLYCPNCKQVVISNVKQESGTFTYLMSGLMCIVGCWPCCLIPFCVDGCQDAQHDCPRCGLPIAQYRRM